MMTSRATLTLLGVLTATTLATPALAATVHFTLTAGTVTGSFSINTAIAPTVYSLGKYSEYKGVEVYFNKFPARPYWVSFYTSGDKGGINIAAPGGGDSSAFGGAQVFAGTTGLPSFINGTYNLIRPPYGALGKLTITGAPALLAKSALFASAGISAVPLPPGILLFSSALAGLGVMGFRKGRKPPEA